MSNLLYKRHPSENKGHINWPELVFYAEGAREGFQEVSITTLKSHYNSICQEVAVGSVEYTGDDEAWFEAVRKRAEWEMDNSSWFVREHVAVDEQKNVNIVIDVDLIDDVVVELALSMLEEADIPGRTDFGEPKTFTSQQIREIQHNDSINE